MRIIHILQLLVLIISAELSYSLENPDLIYKYVGDYDWIWGDLGSDSDNDISIWRPKEKEYGYCLLGDVATKGYGMPPRYTLSVKALTDGAVAQPESFSSVWNDAGSDADQDVVIYRMNPPSGYTCLGDVAMGNYNTLPDKTKYCCVKDELVTTGEALYIWNDAGTDADADVSFWELVRGLDFYGVDAVLFYAHSSYSQPSAETVHLLKHDNVKVKDAWSLPQSVQKGLSIYEVRKSNKAIWTDSGSGSKTDLSIWRTVGSEDYLPMGDLAHTSYSEIEVGFLAKDNDKFALSTPYDFRPIWNDAGSGASSDVQIYEPLCEGGFVALGHVAIGNHNNKPTFEDVTCVNGSYVVPGTWSQVWTDAGTGAAKDVAFWRANRKHGSIGQGVDAVSASEQHCCAPGTAYVLNPEMINYFSEKPIIKIEVFDVAYDLSAEKKLDNPVKMYPTAITNDDLELVQQVSRTITFVKSYESTWTLGEGFELGIETKYEGGVPLLGGAETTLSATVSRTYEYGETLTTEEADEIRVTVNVPPNSKIVAYIMAQEYKSDIPYVATVKKTYFDGTWGTGKVQGEWKGVTITEANVRYEAAVPLS